MVSCKESTFSLKAASDKKDKWDATCWKMGPVWCIPHSSDGSGHQDSSLGHGLAVDRVSYGVLAEADLLLPRL